MLLQRDVASLDFNYDSHWISKQCNAGLPFVSAGPLLTSVVKFGLVWNLIWIAFAVFRWEETSVPFLITWGLVLL